MWRFHGGVLQRTARNRSKVRAARAARLFTFVIQPMKVLICGVVVAVPVVDAKAP